MLENPTVYVDSSDNTDDIPDNVNIVYRTTRFRFDENGDPFIDTSVSDEPSAYEVESLDENNEQIENVLRPPTIDQSSIVSTPHELYDGSIVSDITFSVSDPDGAKDYEVRYTQ